MLVKNYGTNKGQLEPLVNINPRHWTSNYRGESQLLEVSLWIEQHYFFSVLKNVLS